MNGKNVIDIEQKTYSSRGKEVIRYCTKCVIPHTKPDIHLDEHGVCNACRSYENRKNINWSRRYEELNDILKRYRGKSGNYWDCIVPVSGGKDSTFQLIRVLELGMRPLCVNAKTCDLSNIGRKNLENIKELGVDLIDFSPNPVVRRKLNRLALQQVGDISWPEHVSIFTIPVRIAVQYRIPLIIWGENSQNEYGGPAAAAENNILDRRWLEEFGGLLGLRVSDLVGLEGLVENDLIPYIYPSNEELQKIGVTGFFLGYFFPWDGMTNALVSQAYGLETYPHTVEGTMLNYDKLDNCQHGIHDYFKFLKFGFARATDQACVHIRRGRISRKDGIEIVRRLDGKFPHSYVGKPLEEILKPLGLSIDEFIKICDRFTNKKIFLTDNRGNLIKDKDNNLTKVNYDNP
ncbi:MAG: N-acetyl sugar amidotransferase [Candidatus Omnitrophica bacterium]|nr:N-acetyl sugar amidotransferase [Candidatus Omnitrophota bacterium]